MHKRDRQALTSKHAPLSEAKLVRIFEHDQPFKYSRKNSNHFTLRKGKPLWKGCEKDRTLVLALFGLASSKNREH